MANDSGLFWLERVHAKIWNRGDLESELFQKVEVTQTDYANLQERLKEQHPDRDLPEYNGEERNVRSVKLDVLRSISLAKALSPRRPDNNEDQVDDDDDSLLSKEGNSEIDVDSPGASDDEDGSGIDVDAPGPNDEDGSEIDVDAPGPNDEDGSEIDVDAPGPNDEGGSEIDVDTPGASNEDGSDFNSFFPFTLRFLDLSTLGFKDPEILGRFPSLLFIRQEYDRISALIKDKPKSKRGSVIVSGQPGTGEVLVSLSHSI